MRELPPISVIIPTLNEASAIGRTLAALYHGDVALPDGAERYQRRNADGTWAESDDVTESLRQDVKQRAKTKKPRNEGDKGD